jgi:hypothetical protein
MGQLDDLEAGKRSLAAGHLTKKGSDPFFL